MKSALATLLVLGLLSRGTADDSAVCCDVEGCLCNGEPWQTHTRDVPAPRCEVAEHISVTLFNRNSLDGQKVPMRPSISLPNYDSKLPTYILIAPYVSTPSNLYHVKDNLLLSEDANVMFIEWGDDVTKNVTYSQGVSDSRVVGAQVSRLVLFLKESYSIDPKTLQCIGQGIGAHICGYGGRPLKIGRITALGPAGPLFDGHCPEVRVNTDDTYFLTAIHTDAKGLRCCTGLGMIDPIGDVDFYVNGGEDQPGCLKLKRPVVKSVNELHGDKLLSVVKYVACTHSRATDVFADVVADPTCIMWGHKHSVFGYETTNRKPMKEKKFSKCNLQKCAPLELHSSGFPGRKSFYLPTTDQSPYCWRELETTQRMNKLLARAKKP